jgi:hypothetical protein
MENLLEYKTDNLYICTFTIPIYESKVCFLKFTDTDGYLEALKYLEELGVKTADYKSDEYQYAYGFTFKDRGIKGWMHFLFINGSEEYKPDLTNTLAHETYHLISKISEHHGLEQTEGGDNEHIAYLTGYLFNQIAELNNKIL